MRRPPARVLLLPPRAMASKSGTALAATGPGEYASYPMSGKGSSAWRRAAVVFGAIAAAAIVMAGCGGGSKVRTVTKQVQATSSSSGSPTTGDPRPRPARPHR